MWCPCVLEPKENHTCDATPGKRQDFAEVKVKGQDYSVLRDGFLEDLLVGHSLQALVAEVAGVVPLSPEPLDYTDVDAHVSEKAHDVSRSADFFLR